MPELQRVLPKYLQIANYIRDQILRGDLPPGAEVPSERQIAVDWEVARPTAARALEALRNQGFVESRKGSGTFVRQQGQPNRLARERYSRAQETGFIYPPNERAEIIAAEIAPVPANVAAALGIAAGGEAARRQRIIYADDHPVEISTAWYPAAVGQLAPLLLERQRIRPGTLVYVEQSTGRQARYARDEMSARLATAEERTRLRLDEPAAVLVVHHLVYDADDRPLEFTEAVYPPGRWAFDATYPIA
ncbi:GntR family transcriptional regulator [Dactylosporangium vinaceum]|uniref:GntR family transcriptional regulator n=1 Tax=Dactylosporangium vinaceum TaxID=53362 RepID=A0ABV5MQQ6_9ACTN|nr:GntR family transcriptional regulator [Dactylosporangium vinaceum]UAB96373.1 GntR family transcriptional regulator [Dactylosporangium vinaceum]